jgi:hypothetical protein
MSESPRESNSNRNTVVERKPRSRTNTESWASDVSVGTNVGTNSSSPPRAGSQIFMQTGERRDIGNSPATGEEIQNAKLVLYLLTVSNSFLDIHLLAVK